MIFENPLRIDGNLVIDYMNDTDDKHGVAIIEIKPGLGIDYRIYLVQNYIMNAFTVEDFGACEEVIMAPIWLFEGLPKQGITSYSYSAHIDSASVGIVSEVNSLPSELTLLAAYPNPFNGEVRVSFASPRDGECAFIVYGLTGDEVFESSYPVRAGSNSITWRPSDDIASGVHFYRVIQSGNTIAGKFMYLK